MLTLQELESKITDFTVRVGATIAQRHDLDILGDQSATPPEEPAFDLNLHLKPGNNFLRIDVDLRFTDKYASYQTVVSGQWLSEDESAFESVVDLPDPTLEEFFMTKLAPQILAVAQGKILDLARGIDCPTLTFPYSLSRDLQNLRPLQEASQEVAPEDSST